jgi:hypothetical protein
MKKSAPIEAGSFRMNRRMGSTRDRQTLVLPDWRMLRCWVFAVNRTVRLWAKNSTQIRGFGLFLEE